MDHANANVGDGSLEVAHLCLLDAFACAFQALQQAACTRVLGPVVPGATMTFGARVPGTSLQLDPVQAAFNLGVLIGGLDQRDPVLATRDGHLSDSLGALLSVADYLARKSLAEGREPLKVRDLLSALIAADALTVPAPLTAMTSSDDRSHAIEIRCATAVASLLGGGAAQIQRARELATDDVRPVRVALRPLWWLGDANARGVRLALLAMAEVPGTAEPPTLESSPQPSAPPPTLLDSIAATRIRDRFTAAVALHFPAAQAEKIRTVLTDPSRSEALPINELVSLTVRN